MGRLVVDVACLAAVVLSGAHGQGFGHFGTAPAPTPSSIESMVARAVQQQVALQTGACASEWAGRFSYQCPAGAFMALKGYSTTVGLVPVNRCEPTGCLHAPPGQGENIYNLVRLHNQSRCYVETIAVWQVDAPCSQSVKIAQHTGH